MTESMAKVIYYINSIIFLFMTYYGFIRLVKPAVKKRWILLAYTGFLVISSQQFFVLDSVWMNLLVNTVALMMISLLFSGNIGSRILFAIFMYVASMVADVIAFTGLNYIYNIQNGTDMPQIYIYSVERTVTNVIYLPLLLICILFFRRYFKDRVSHTHFKIPKMYTIAVLLMMIGVIVIDVLLYVVAIKEVQTEADKIIVSQFIVLIVIFLIIRFYDAMLDYLDEREKSRLKDQMLERWESQYRTAMSLQKAVSDLEHNMRYTFVELTGLLENGKTEEAIDHLRQEIGRFDKISAVVTTGNMPIDTMLNYYRQKAVESLGIELETRLSIPPNLNLDSGLLVSILGNALENAIEACEKVERSQRYIRIKAIFSKKRWNSTLLIAITNPYAITPIVDKENNLITTKQNKSKHGLGLASIMEMLPEKTGHINLEYDNNIFRFMLFLHNVADSNFPKITNDEPSITNVE